MSLLLLTDVKPHLKITGTTDDTVLQGKLDAAEAYVSRAIGGFGALASTSVTDVVYGQGSIAVLNTPILAVTSVTGEKMGALNMSDLVVDKESGVIRPAANTWFMIADYYTVVYTTGYTSAASLSADLVEAIRLMTQHFYETQRGGKPANVGGDPGTSTESFARAQQILGNLSTGSFA